MSPVGLPADWSRIALDRQERASGKPGGWALVAAALAHAVVIAWLGLDWRFGETPQAPAPILVALLFEPPAPPPPGETKPPKFRESGPDEETTALPPAETTAPAPAAPPPAVAEQQQPVSPAEAEAAAEIALPEPKPKPPQSLVRLEQPRAAPTPRARQPAPPQASMLQLGDKDRRGDPYLNELLALIDRNRPSTTPIGSFGLHLEGTAAFHFVLDRAGRLRSVTLAQSSGAVLLDQELEDMIRSAAPFPPPPPGFRDPLSFTIVEHLGPE